MTDATHVSIPRDVATDLADVLSDRRALTDARRRELLAALRPEVTDHAECERVAESLGGMVEWLAEVVVDTRDSLRVGGCNEHVLTAEQSGALEAATRILARERNANPSRYDTAVERARRAEDRLEAVRAALDAEATS